MIPSDDLEHQQNSDWILVSPQKHPSLVQRIASFIIFLQKSRAINNFFYSFSTTILLIQHFVSSLYIMAYPGDKSPTSFDYLLEICSCIVRLIPVDSTKATKECTIILLFSLTIVSLIFIFSIFFTVKHHIIFYSTITHILINISLCYLTIFMPISLNLFLDSIFCFLDEPYPLYLIISLLNFVFIFAGFLINRFVHNQLLSFNPIFGATWISVPLTYVSLNYVISFAATEVVVHSIDNNFIAHSCLVIRLILYLLSSAISSNILPFILFSYQILVFFFNAMGAVTTFLTLFSLLIKNSDTTIVVVLTLSLPVAVTSFLFIKSSTDKLLVTIFSAIESNDFSAIEKMNHYKLSVALCISYHLIGTDYSIFDAAVRSHPDSFLITFVIGKLTAIDANNPSMIKTILTEMKRRASNSIINWTSVSMFQLAFFDMTHDTHSQSIRMINICNSIVDDFLSALHLFWTEVLLGRTERLASLAQEANSKYNQAISTFSQLMPKYGRETGMIECFDRFLSFVPIRLRKEPFTKLHTLNDILFENSYRIFTQVKKLEVKLENNVKTVFSPAASMLQDIARNRLSILHHLTSFLPFYFMTILLIIYGVILFDPLTQNNETWQVYQKLLQILYDFSSCLFALTILPPYTSDFPPPAKLHDFINLKNWVFPSNLTDPINDIQYLLDDARSNIAELIDLLDTLPLSNEVRECFDQKNKFYLYTTFETKEEELSVFALLSEYIIQFGSQTVINNPNIFQVFSSNFTDILQTNYKIVTNCLINIINKTLEIEPPIIINRFEKTERSFYIVIPVAAVAMLISLAICHILMNQIQSELFLPFLTLPKTVVSELLEKVGDKLALPASILESLEQEQRFYIRQLSYPSPPSSYLTKIGITVRYIIYIFIYFLIYVLLMISVIHVKGIFIRDSADSLAQSKTLMFMPHVLYLYSSHFVNYENLHFFPIDKNMELQRESLLTVTDYFHLNYVYQLSNISNIPPIYESSLYYDDILCHPDNMNKLCFSLSNSLMYLITNILDVVAVEFIDNGSYFEREKIDEVVRNIFFTLSFTQRNVIDPFFDSVESFFDVVKIDLFNIFIMNLLILLLLMIISQTFINYLVFSPQFSTAVLSSVPLHVLNTNEKALEVMAPKKVKNEIGYQILNRSKTLESISDIIILVNNSEEIVYSTPNTASKLQIEINEGITDKFSTFLQNLSKKMIKLEIPPTHDQTMPITFSLADQTKCLFLCTLIPMDNFSYDGHDISFACVLQDVTYRDTLIRRMNQEANQLRLLMSQIVPTPVAMSMLEDGQFNMFLLNKSCIGSFYLSGVHNLQVDQISKIHTIIRKLLNSDSDLTFLGRSCQHFRVISGLFSTMITIPEMANKIVKFSLKLLKKIKSFQQKNNKVLDLYCCIHMGSQYLADVIKDPLPVFDLYGTQMNVSELIMLKFPPNHVLVTNTMFEVLSDDNYDITYFSYVSRPNGSKYKVYSVEYPVNIS
ncbi:hypothetical protein TRFO_15195 [Tritrichomonas foetus]|uniref:Guanylate cyclase domain-containing protein n=1 Tax=Tritrichomonas foetus TaxID=1144522 RepID=A0A1J4KSZ5_9EUKA|nr:hypothetical protein TRFO_15195 [Tritrichomonas foetus]|eukprot:OHT14417.1 hypothetical protein TRFO_15195 [Tritrichomonas foetus]